MRYDFDSELGESATKYLWIILLQKSVESICESDYGNGKYDDHNDNIFDSSKGTRSAAISSSLHSILLPKYIKTTITMNTVKVF